MQFLINLKIPKISGLFWGHPTSNFVCFHEFKRYELQESQSSDNFKCCYTNSEQICWAVFLDKFAHNVRRTLESAIYIWLEVITSVKRLGYFSFLGRIDLRIRQRGARNKQLLVDHPPLSYSNYLSIPSLFPFCFHLPHQKHPLALQTLSTNYKYVQF